ncbi:hypothetical protein A5874_001850, partial [Enterococcus faecium]
RNLDMIGFLLFLFFTVCHIVCHLVNI